MPRLFADRMPRARRPAPTPPGGSVAPSRGLRAAAAVAAAVLGLAGSSAAHAQLAAPNAAGVAMGHVHFTVGDVAAAKAFWTNLGGTPKRVGALDAVVFPGVVVLLAEGGSAGRSEGAVVNHVAFRVRSLAELERRGFAIERNEQYVGVASVYTPEGERIELFDDGLATNLYFVQDDGGHDPVAERHNRKIDAPIVAHHIHIDVPEADVAAAKAWYAERFGGVRGKRWRYEAVDLPGINLNFSGVAAAQAPTRGRLLDHIGFEVANLEAFCRRLEAEGIELDRPYEKLPSGLGVALLTDPWGTTIELTEGLRTL